MLLFLTSPTDKPFKSSNNNKDTKKYNCIMIWLGWYLNIKEFISMWRISKNKDWLLINTGIDGYQITLKIL